MLGGERLLLDDRFHVWRFRRLAQNAAVGSGILERGGQDGHGRLLSLVELPELLEGLRADERHVSGEHQNVLVAGDGFARTLDGVASAALFGLLDETDAGGGNRCFDPLGLVANDGINVAGRNNLAGGGNDVGQQGLSADLMQHLGAAGVEASALARG